MGCLGEDDQTGCLGEDDQTEHGVPQGGVGRGGGTPSPSLVGSHDALRGSGYIGQARPQDVTPSFELVLCEVLSVASVKNVHNEKALGLASRLC